MTVAAYDVTGRMMRMIAQGATAAGWHVVEWDLRNETGSRVGAGLYFVRMMVDGKAYTRHVTVLR